MISGRSTNEGIYLEIQRLIIWLDGCREPLIEQRYAEVLWSTEPTRTFLLSCRPLRPRRGALELALVAASIAMFFCTAHLAFSLSGHFLPEAKAVQAAISPRLENPLPPEQTEKPVIISVAPSLDPSCGRADPFKPLISAKAGISQERSSVLPPPRMAVFDSFKENMPESPPSDSQTSARPPASPAPVFSSSETMRPKLLGIVSDEKGAIAMIQKGGHSLFLHAGEQSDGLQVVSIEQEKLLLKVGAEVLALSLELREK